MVQVTIWIDKGKRDELMPLIKRNGMSFSSFVRKMTEDYIQAHKARNQVISIADLDDMDNIEASR